MRLALLQVDTTVGAIEANARLLRERAEAAASEGADLVVTPELALCGYPPRDLLMQEGFVEACASSVRAIASSWTREAPLVVGTPWLDEGGVRNALVVCRDGAIEAVYRKRLLPTYDVFDEERYFRAGDTPVVIEAGGRRVGLMICEDLWRGGDIVAASGGAVRYDGRPDPVAETVAAGAQCLVVASASPFTHDKLREQRRLLGGVARTHRVPVASTDLVGASDDFVFPGASAIYDVRDDGAPVLVASGPVFEEACVVATIGAGGAPVVDLSASMSREELLFGALVTGVRGYFGKVGAREAVLGVSGGIDSAVVCAVASAALGAEHVYALAMPSRYSSDHSLEDARALADNLGVRYAEAPIAPAHDTMERAMAALFEGFGLTTEHGLAEENVQSRLRGVTVMALANKAGALALATGNKSELAVGYCTLYGDMNGGLGVISDVLKTDVYALARWLNDHHERAGFAKAPTPGRTIEKPPSAELAPGQLDSDSLPSYDVLDTIVRMYVEERRHPVAIARETGYDEELVVRFARLIDRNEHKRKQMPVGIKVSPIAFGRGRRRPLAQGWAFGE